MKRLVLIGAGHAQAQVLHEFAQRKSSDVELVLVSPFALAPYSGMVPGWLAGHYEWTECCIDFEKLCMRAGARLLIDSVARIDTVQSEVVMASGLRLGFDWLSVNIGSTLKPPQSVQLRILPMRPLSALCERWNDLLDSVGRLPADAPYRLLMIGGGAAGVESILAAQHRLTRMAPHVAFQFTLATNGDDILPGMAKGAARRLRASMQKRKIALVENFSASHVEGKAVFSSQGESLEADAALWATGAQAYAWPAQSGLSTDERGFIRIDPMLRSVSHPNIFASGDCARWEPPLPKAGVFSVRMGPVLAHNLQAAVRNEPLRTYRAQRRYLVLIGSGPKHAVGAWGQFAWQGDWVWRWKEHIDRKFLARYNQ